MRQVKKISKIPIKELDAAMLIENELIPARIENRPVLIFSGLFIAVILVAICALSVMLLNELKKPYLAAQQDIPKESLSTAIPAANHFSISLPIVLSGSVSVSEQIWKVTKIGLLEYELDGQKYDFATFTRIDDQDTAQGYCINRGWEIPDIGAEYLLNAEGIFVPLYELDTHPIQRFLKIQ